MQVPPGPVVPVTGADSPAEAHYVRHSPFSTRFFPRMSPEKETQASSTKNYYIRYRARVLQFPPLKMFAKTKTKLFSTQLESFHFQRTKPIPPIRYPFRQIDRTIKRIRGYFIVPVPVRIENIQHSGGKKSH